MSDEFVPLDLLQRNLRLWWLLLLGLLLGGAVGYAFHAAQPPLYESQAVLTFSFDYARLGKLTDAEEDMAMGVAGTLMGNPARIAALNAQAQALGLLPPGFDLRANANVERKSYRWVLRLRSPDPQNARKAAQLWLEMSDAALKEAIWHAEQVNLLRRQLNGLESCLQRMTVSEPASAQCAWPTQPELQTQLGQLGQQLANEAYAAQGMIVGLSYTVSDTPQVPPQAVVFGRSSLVLAGGLLGFLAAFLILSSGLLDGPHIGKKHAVETGSRR